MHSIAHNPICIVMITLVVGMFMALWLQERNYARAQYLSNNENGWYFTNRNGKRLTGYHADAVDAERELDAAR